MSETARTLIQSALEELGAYAPGDPPDDADIERGLTVLNDMLEDWSNQDLACHAMQTQTFTTTNGQGSYTIGLSGADITATRPLKIESPAWLQNTDGTRILVDVVSELDWRRMYDHSMSGPPSVLYYDPQSPLGIINLYPVPNAAITVGFVSFLQLARFASLSTALTLPVGYGAAIKPNLAVELSPFFNRPPPQMTIAKAIKTLANLKRKNQQDIVADIDCVLLGGSGRSHILTDG